MRLRQILLNLVGNAMKFTERGEVTVVCGLDDQQPADQSRVRLHAIVRDTGSGIPREKQQMIFEAFTQADGSTTRRHGGTGLGLSISSKLVALMDGRLWLESELGRGSAFHFALTLEKAVETRAAASASASPAAIAAGTPHALLAEDHSVNRFMATRLLENHGYRVTAVTNGRAAVEAIAQQPFDLVLMDVQMPELNGFEATIAIRASEAGTGRHTPIVAMTAHAMAEDRVRCLAAGMDGVVTKPIDVAELFAAIDAARAKGRPGSAA